MQIIFDGFTVGRYDEGLEEHEFEATDTSLMSASGTDACKYFFCLLFLSIHKIFINILIFFPSLTFFFCVQVPMAICRYEINIFYLHNLHTYNVFDMRWKKMKMLSVVSCIKVSHTTSLLFFRSIPPPHKSPHKPFSLLCFVLMPQKGYENKWWINGGIITSVSSLYFFLAHFY